MKEKQNNFFISTINKMLEISGSKLTYYDVLDVPDWYTKNTMTEQQEAEFKEWYLLNFRKFHRATKKYTNESYGWFNLAYGLKIS